MEALFLYILKSTACLILFFVSFKALLSNDTFFRFNRGVLLAGINVCMLLPLVRMETKEVSLIQQPVIQLEQIILEKEAARPLQINSLAEVTITTPKQPGIEINWSRIICGIYIAGCSACLFITFLSFSKMFGVIRSGRKVHHGNHTIILTTTPITPFSWGNYIIISEEDYHHHPNEILTHEYMHLYYRHSIDLMYMEIILLLHWFNPAVWLLKRELREIHEFQADNGVLEQGIDATKYQLLLVKKAVGSSHYTLANSFNHSRIKKRITMMLKEKSNSWGRLKLLLLIPVGLATLNAFASPINWPSDLPSTALTENKDTVNQQITQKEYEYFLVYSEPNSTDIIAIPRKSLYDAERLPNNSVESAKVIIIRPRYEGVPAAYLEKVKNILEAKGNTCKIDPTVPDTRIARRISGAIFIIQDKQIKCVMNGDSDPSLLENLCKSKSIVIQPNDKYILLSEIEKVKKLLDDKGFESKINPEPFKKGDALAPPPPPMPLGSVKFVCRDGSERQFFLYKRHAGSRKSIEDEIKQIYSDSIDFIDIKIGKDDPKGLLDMVTKALEKELPYKVRSRSVSLGGSPL